MKIPLCIIIMGVSGSGKTTIGNHLASRIGGIFIDSDALHPMVNIEKMKNGIPLTDNDRWPWLDKIVEIAQKEVKVRHVVIACSALKNSYRRRLSSIPCRFVFLQGSKKHIKARLKRREEHFMPIKLLENQFNTLEVPQNAMVVPVNWTIERIVERIIKEISIL